MRLPFVPQGMERAAHNDGALSFSEFALFLSQQQALPEFRIYPEDLGGMLMSSLKVAAQAPPSDPIS